MLQNNSAVVNLQYDSDLRIAQQNRVEPILFRESNIITSQPRNPFDPEPISVIPTNNTGFVRANPFTARTGLDVLHGIPSVTIEQTYELSELLSSFSSENRFIIRDPQSKALFAATETSYPKDRMMYGAARPFNLHVLDKTHQEVLIFQKRRTINNVLCCCQAQKLEVWAPSDEYLGRIIEKSSFIDNELVIQNPNDEIILKVNGPPSFSCCFPNEASFNISTPSTLAQKGRITRLWCRESSLYSTKIYFPDEDLDVKTKALYIGAGFLLEYMFFQSKGGCC